MCLFLLREYLVYVQVLSLRDSGTSAMIYFCCCLMTDSYVLSCLFAETVSICLQLLCFDTGWPKCMEKLKLTSVGNILIMFDDRNHPISH